MQDMSQPLKAQPQLSHQQLANLLWSAARLSCGRDLFADLLGMENHSDHCAGVGRKPFRCAINVGARTPVFLSHGQAQKETPKG